MRSDDAYRGVIDEVDRQVDDWATAFRAHAAISVTRGPDHLVVLSEPAARDACRFELSLRPDQMFDIVIGPETYEDLPIDSSSLFRDLAIAIAMGDVVTRTIRSSATGRLIAVETRVALSKGRHWVRSRQIAPAFAEALAFADRHYLPYRERRPALQSA